MRGRAKALAAACSLGLSTTLNAQSCSRLMSLPLVKARVTSARLHAGKPGPLPPGQRLQALPAFCRVTVTARPVAGSLIHMEIWLPRSHWNGRLLASGNGGFGGRVDYLQLAAGLQQSFVSVGSDAGTSPANPEDGDALIGRPQRWQDWAGRAVHVMTLISKQVAAAYYGRGPRFSYFHGCSTGGEQGLAEAQMYPADFDGILSGAPANDRTRLHVAILHNFEALEQGERAGLSQSDLVLLHQAVLQACLAQQAPGGWLIDPPRCTFDPQTLLCSARRSLACLNQAEIDAVQRIYAGPRDGKGRPIYPGLERGSELGWWAANHARQGVVPFGSLFRWVWGPGWNWRSFDLDRDTQVLDRKLGPLVNATSVDLSAFAKLNHKLVLFHGWNDPLVAPLASIRYFEQVKSSAESASRSGAEQPGNGVAPLRLYLIPGLGHCTGGIDFSDEPLLQALMAWVEQGSAPAALRVSSSGQGDAAEAALYVVPYPGLGGVGEPAPPR